MASTKPSSETQITHDFTEMVAVKVGEMKKEFHVHRTFLTKSSKFFCAAMQKHWAEGEAKVVELPEIKTDAFASYLNWLYTGILIESSHDIPQYQSDLATSKERQDLGAVRYEALCHIAILADVLDESVLRDIIVDAFLRTTSKLHLYAGPHHIEKLWANLPPKSKLLTMLTDYYAVTADVQLFERPELSDRLPSDFKLGVLVVLKKEKMGGDKLITPGLSNRCRYHEHGKDKKCN